MEFNDFRDMIKRRAQIEEENYSEIEACWEEMIDLFASDINRLIGFLDVCAEDEFSWLSEIFDGIAERSRSREFIAVLYQTAEKYPEETRKYNILEFIASAEYIVNE